MSDNPLAPLAPPIFSPDVLEKNVHDTLDSALSAIPPGADGAFILDGTVTNNQPAAQLLVATRLGKHWSVGAGGTWDGHHVEGKFALAGSWNWHHN